MNDQIKKIVLGIAFGFVTSLPSLAEDQLPVHDFEVVCAPSQHEYVSELRDIANFARTHEAVPVYVSIRVEATARSGFCSLLRDGPGVDALNQPEDHGIRSPYLDSPPNTLVVWARTLDQTAGTTTLSLPPLDTLPGDGLYEARTGTGDFYLYVGPAVLRHSTGNGNEHVEFQPILNSHAYWKEIMAIRNTSAEVAQD